MTQSPKPAGTALSLPYFKERSHRLIAALALAMLLMVSAIGWFQYEQIDRLTHASLKGKDNIVWDFYKLEVLLMDFQSDLRELLSESGKPALLPKIYQDYNLFASQIQTAEVVSSGQVMREQASFQTAMSMAKDYIERSDVFLAQAPDALQAPVAQALLAQSLPLRSQLHKLVLAAYQTENLRATQALVEMRRFTFLYGLSSFLLLVLVLATGSLTLRRILLNERLQLERAELLREKKEAAEAANQAKARFLSSASHDLRQPAHALGLFMERIEQVSDDPMAKNLVAHAMSAVREMQNMLDSMFDLSHLDSESAPTKIRAFPIQDVLDSVRGMLEGEALAKGLRLRIRPSTVWLESDSSLLHRVLLNLVGNAIRYTNHGTVLLVCRPARSGTHAHIEVWDSGIGIAQQEQQKVFQEFYQVANPQRDRRLGMGVGLSVVERCCRLLKHPLSLHSRLGYGTRVRLEVPRAQCKPAPDATAVHPKWASEAVIPAQVLLVEDDVMGRLAMAELLKSWGYSVLAVESAKMAAEQFHKHPAPDILISDLRLGGGSNGIEAIALLRELAGKPVAAFLISGDTGLEVQQQVKAAGLILLSKPVRPAKLRSLLRHLGTKDAASMLFS